MNEQPSSKTSGERLADITQDARWHLYQFEAAERATAWLKLSEQQFRDASFLDQRLLHPVAGQAANAGPELFALDQVANTQNWPATSQILAQAHFIFHIGHCGSTLLSRALAATPNILPIREPLTLRQLAASYPDGKDMSWEGKLQLALAAHSRPFHPGQLSMIKATSICNALIQPIMEQSPASRVLLMYVPLEAFLAGMLGKHSPPLDLRGHLAARLEEWCRLTGKPFPLPAAGEFKDAQLAALSWLTSMARLQQAHASHPDRCMLLDFGQFLTEPEAGLEQLIDFFSLADVRSEIIQAWPDISMGYSKKPDEPYSAFNRNKILSRGRMLRGEEIQSAMHWAQKLIQQYPAFSACSAYIGHS